MKILVLTLLLPLISCHRKTALYSFTIPVNTAIAIEQDIPYILKAVGRLEASLYVDIRSQVNGKIVKMLFQEGQAVNEGDLLYVIDQRLYQSDLAKAKANLSIAKFKLKYAEEFARMYGALVGKEYVSKLDYERGLQEIGTYQGEVEAGAANVEQAEINLSYTEIRSPMKGYVGTTDFNVGNLVEATGNSVLTTIRSVVPLNVTFTLPSAYVSLLREKQSTSPLYIECFKPNEQEPLKGIVHAIGNTVDPLTGMIVLKGTLANHDEKGWPGEFVRVLTYVDMFKSAVVIPTASLVKTDTLPVVFVIKEDEHGSYVEMKEVTPGLTYEDYTIILSGLSPGEAVVTNGKRNLRPNARVAIISELAS